MGVQVLHTLALISIERSETARRLSSLRSGSVTVDVVLPPRDDPPPATCRHALRTRLLGYRGRDPGPNSRAPGSCAATVAAAAKTRECSRQSRTFISDEPTKGLSPSGRAGSAVRATVIWTSYCWSERQAARDMVIFDAPPADDMQALNLSEALH